MNENQNRRINIASKIMKKFEGFRIQPSSIDFKYVTKAKNEDINTTTKSFRHYIV